VPGDRFLAEGKLVGMPASPGIVIGPVHLLLWEVPEVPHRIVPDEGIPAEIERLRDAIEKAKARLHQVKRRAEHHAGSEEAAIFEVQLMILSDDELISSVETLIKQNLSAEKAFDLVLIEWRQNFARHTQPRIRERVGDLTDVHIRRITILSICPRAAMRFSSPTT
jgi:phosphotransferase system enzyme I (PtsI)